MLAWGMYLGGGVFGRVYRLVGRELVVKVSKTDGLLGVAEALDQPVSDVLVADSLCTIRICQPCWVLQFCATYPYQFGAPQRRTCSRPTLWHVCLECGAVAAECGLAS